MIRKERVFVHAGQVIHADGTPEAARRIEGVLTTDPGLASSRHAKLVIMRTTLTINDEILDQLKRVTVKEKNMTFKEVVNETLRLGLHARNEIKKRPKFKVKARDLGAHPGLNFDNIEELLDQLEGPSRK